MIKIFAQTKFWSFKTTFPLIPIMKKIQVKKKIQRVPPPSSETAIAQNQHFVLNWQK